MRTLLHRVLVAVLGFMTWASVAGAAPEVKAGFQFVLVVSHQGYDIVYSNEEVADRKLPFGAMNCVSRLESKKDPVYPEQMLGTLRLECEHGGLPLRTSVTCSLLDPAAQAHFEFGSGNEAFSVDLLCRAKAR